MIMANKRIKRTQITRNRFVTSFTKQNPACVAGFALCSSGCYYLMVTATNDNPVSSLHVLRKNIGTSAHLRVKYFVLYVTNLSQKGMDFNK